jgi:hypothetical protein
MSNQHYLDRPPIKGLHLISENFAVHYDPFIWQAK